MTRFDALYREICRAGDIDAILVSHRAGEPDFYEYRALPLHVVLLEGRTSLPHIAGIGNSPEAALEDLAFELQLDIAGVANVG